MLLTDALERVLARHDELRALLSAQGAAANQFAKLPKDIAGKRNAIRRPASGY